jgi:cobalt/nickel transport system ATP-binding protein
VESEPLIQVRGLSYVYPGGVPALDMVSFQVARGESVGLIGPNGAGKTTLFLCLAGVLRIDPGMASLGSLDPAKPSERRKLTGRVGLVFQNSDDQLFNATIFDDVAFGPLNLHLPADEVRRRVTDALKRVGLTGLEERVPYHLSGGEKRRAALAGVLAMQPEILLLDEPTMFLDARARRELIHLLLGLSNTRIIATHDLEMLLETCSRAIILDKGSLVAQGSVRELLANREVMEKHGLEVPYSLR